MVFIGKSENDYTLYAYSKGKLEIILENTIRMDVFTRLGEKYLVSHNDAAIYYTKAADMDIKTIQKGLSAIDLSEDSIDMIIPYSDNELLYVSRGYIKLLKGRKSAVISETRGALEVWS